MSNTAIFPFSSHKNKTPQPLNENKKSSKNGSIKSSSDLSEKEGTDTELNPNLPHSSSNKSNELSPSACPSDDSATTPNYEKTLLASSSKHSSPTPSPSGSINQTTSKQKGEPGEEAHDSDDEELTEHAVNLVVLGEVAGKKYSK